MAREQILQGLLQRGFPAHVAQGIVGNIAVESGFNPGINEIAPLVPGSRGGFGLFQHTGPRRRALEAFASQTGRPLADIDTQLDFVLQELGTTEKAAAEALKGAKTTEEAARIFSEKFLRPGIPHLERRIAAATGQEISGQAATPTLLGSEGNDNMAEQPQGLLGGTKLGEFLTPDRRDHLIAALEGMTLNPNQALIQAASGRIQQRQQDRAQAQQSNRTAEWLRSRGRDDLAEGVAQGVIPANAAIQTALAPPKDDRTALIKNYQFAQSQGFEGSLTDFQQQSGQGTNITVNTGDKTSQFGEAPTGTVWALDEAGNHIMEDVPGSEAKRPMTIPLGGTAAEKRAAEAAEAGGKSEAAAARAQDSIELIDSIINDPALPGITGMIQGRVPPVTQAGTDLNVKINQLKGQAFLQAFETLKGGGQITEREGIAAQNAIARLDRAQSDEAYVAALNELRSIAQRGLDRAQGKTISEAPVAPTLDLPEIPDFTAMSDAELDAYIAQQEGR